MIASAGQAVAPPPSSAADGENDKAKARNQAMSAQRARRSAVFPRAATRFASSPTAPLRTLFSVVKSERQRNRRDHRRTILGLPRDPLPFLRRLLDAALDAADPAKLL